MDYVRKREDEEYGRDVLDLPLRQDQRRHGHEVRLLWDATVAWRAQVMASWYGPQPQYRAPGSQLGI